MSSLNHDKAAILHKPRSQAALLTAKSKVLVDNDHRGRSSRHIKKSL